MKRWAPEKDQEEARVAAWNAHHPPGTPVDLIDDLGGRTVTATRGPAWVSESGHAMIALESHRGGWLLERVIPRRGAGGASARDQAEAELADAMMACRESCLALGAQPAELDAEVSAGGNQARIEVDGHTSIVAVRNRVVAALRALAAAMAVMREEARAEAAGRSLDEALRATFAAGDDAPPLEHPLVGELVSYHLRELPDDQAESLRDHLAACPACAAAVLAIAPFRPTGEGDADAGEVDEEHVAMAWADLQERLAEIREGLPSSVHIERVDGDAHGLTPSPGVPSPLKGSPS